MTLLFRTFLAQFFTSEDVTSDVQMRQTIIWVVAFILTPCLMILPHAYPSVRYLTIRVGRMQTSPAAIIRANAVRHLLADDLIERGVAILTGYSAITVGSVAVFVWDALSFDRRDAMVLGPLPLRSSEILLAKLGALAALLLGTSVAINALNATAFALATADRLGFVAFLAHFVGTLTVTLGAATVVFSVIVAIRATLAIVGGPRLAGTAGALLQFLFTAAILWLVITIFATPQLRGDFGPTRSVPLPVNWFVAWFEVIRRGDRASWAELVDMSYRAQLLLVGTVAVAVATSIAAFHRQMRAALTPAARPGPLGQARTLRVLGRALVGRDPRAAAIVDFVLMTLARNRVQQGYVAMNAAVGLAWVLLGLMRNTGDVAEIIRPAPLLVAFWSIVGLRASFFVPSELPAAWAFRFHARDGMRSLVAGVRAATSALVAPPIAVAAWVIGGAAYAVQCAAIAVVLANGLVLTIDFVPFTRPYVPGHAKLKTRWPLYVVACTLTAYALPHMPFWALVGAAAVLYVAGDYRGKGWSLEPRADLVDDSAITVLDLVGARGV